MHVVVEDDDPDHDSQAEGHRLLAGEAAAVLPAGGEGRRMGGLDLGQNRPFLDEGSAWQQQFKAS